LVLGLSPTSIGDAPLKMMSMMICQLQLRMVWF